MAAVAAERTNEGLVRQMREDGDISSDIVESAFLEVDRGLFLKGALPDGATEGVAYEDRPLRFTKAHLSAPSLYARAVEALDFREGSTFLNLGSGSGYVSGLAPRLHRSNMPDVAHTKHALGLSDGVPSTSCRTSLDALLVLLPRIGPSKSTQRDTNTLLRVTTRSMPGDQVHTPRFASSSSSDQYSALWVPNVPRSIGSM
jgi:hypothetical protein